MRALLRRFCDILRQLPARLLRLGKHFYHWDGDAAYASFSFGARLGFWLMELILLLLEIFGIGEWYDLASAILKFQSRPLSIREQQLAQSIFGKSIRYASVRIDERAYLGPRQGRFCYVSFFTINSWGNLSDSLLIHELTHVWQYQKLGICYIPRALAAQVTHAGYNYGGNAGLMQALETRQGLDFFNLEQQADLIEDYFRLQKQLPAKWNQQPEFQLYKALLARFFQPKNR